MGSGRNTVSRGLFTWPSFPSPALFSLVLSTEGSRGSGRQHPPLPQSSWTTAKAKRELQSSSNKASPFSGSLKGSSVTRYELKCKRDQGKTSGKERKGERREKEKQIRKKERNGTERMGGGEEEKGERRRVEERREGAISLFKQVLSVIYICLQNEKCVP